MWRENDCGKAKDRGSINTNATKLCVQNILEGGPAAFLRPKTIYNHEPIDTRVAFIRNLAFRRAFAADLFMDRQMNRPDFSKKGTFTVSPFPNHEFLASVDAAVARQPLSDEQALAFAYGCNFRLNMAKAFEAAAKAAAFGLTFSHVVSGHPQPTDIGGVYSGLSFWKTFLDSIRESMTALEYVICVAVAEHADGVAKADVEDVVKKYIDDKVTVATSNWLSLSKKTLADAKVECSQGKFEEVIAEMLKPPSPRLAEKNGKLTVAARNFVWGLTETK